MITCIFKRKGNGPLKKKCCNSSVLIASLTKIKIKIKAAYCGSLTQGRQQSPQVTISSFCETKQKARAKGAVWQDRKGLKTPRSLLGPSQFLLSLWAGEAVLMSTNVTIRCLNAQKYTQNEKKVTDTDKLSQPHCHQNSLKCPHKENKKKSTFCNRIFFFFIDTAESHMTLHVAFQENNRNGKERSGGCLLPPSASQPGLPRVRILLGASVELLSGIIPLAFDTFLDMIISLLAVYQQDHNKKDF